MSLDWIEIALGLVIVLVVFGPSRWLELARSLRQLSAGNAKPNARQRSLLALALSLLAGQVTLFALAKAAVITAAQSSIALCVLIVWLIVGWLCFGKERD